MSRWTMSWKRRYRIQFEFVIFLSCFGLVGLVADTATARIIYVRDSIGDDSRSVEEATVRETPLKTIQRGVDLAEPGDLVFVQAGTYREHVRIRRSGAPGNPITIAGTQPGTSRIIGSIGGIGVRYVTVRNLNISNSEIPDIPQELWPLEVVDPKGIYFYLSHNIRILNNCVHHCRGGGMAINQSDNIWITGNLVYANAALVPTDNSGISVYQPFLLRNQTTPRFTIVVNNNICYSNSNGYFNRPITDGHGILFDDFRQTQRAMFDALLPFYIDEIEKNGEGEYEKIVAELDFETVYNLPTSIEGNLCFNNGGAGIQAYLTDGVEIRNNACVFNQQNVYFFAELMLLESERCKVHNNLLISPEQGEGISEDGSPDQRVAGLARNIAGERLAGQRFFRCAIFDTPSSQFQVSRSGFKVDPSRLFLTDTIFMDRDDFVVEFDGETGEFSFDASGLLVDRGARVRWLQPRDMFGALRIRGEAIDIGPCEMESNPELQASLIAEQLVRLLFLRRPAVSFR